jgi:hypothetical protein
MTVKRYLVCVFMPAVFAVFGPAIAGVINENQSIDY